jgi:hypothetical protein
MSIYDKKWQKFLSRIWLFKFIPFVDFVLAAGSLATGNIREDSDFDVIVGARQGRIFTVRAFCILAFGFFGWRRKNYRSYKTYKTNRTYSDKFCFNHFVTPAAYRLSEPHNEYWKKLYSSLVPVFGSPEMIQKFFEANEDWITNKTNEPYKTNGTYRFNKFHRPGELILSGRFGDWLERKLKAIQIRRIEKSLKTDLGYKPRIIYNDNELEFHPDTKRIEDFK